MRIFFLILAGLLASSAQAGDIYGNEAGCSLPFTGDSAIRIEPKQIIGWESSCDLPQNVDYSGAAFTASCWDQGEQFTWSISLHRLDDAMTYTDQDGRTVELHRCP